jgi:phospholipid-translocating ATPase
MSSGPLYSSPNFTVPRVLVKFVSTSFTPQDADIIRYMWVKGDLKRRLGIKPHRIQQASVDVFPTASEATPIFRTPHARSISEMSTPDGYEPALSHSPGEHTPPTQPEQLYDTPPQISATLDDSSSSPRRIPTPVANTSEDKDVRLSTPTKAAHAAAVPPSPQHSYYSASDIPAPSPLPSRGFQHPSQAHPTITSISYSRPLRGQYPSHVHSDNLQVPPNLYEMHVRRPIDPHPERGELSEISEASHATATEIDPEGSHRPPSSTPDGGISSRQLTYEEGPTAL